MLIKSLYPQEGQHQSVSSRRPASKAKVCSVLLKPLDSEVADNTLQDNDNYLLVITLSHPRRLESLATPV
jgi:hypothetical protein